MNDIRTDIRHWWSVLKTKRNRSLLEDFTLELIEHVAEQELEYGELEAITECVREQRDYERTRIHRIHEALERIGGVA